MSLDQPCFPGFESYFTPEPLPPGTYLVVDLLKWYRDKAAGGLCWAFQRTIAAKLHRSIRWLNDRLQALVRRGALKITHRGPHSCFYQLAEHFAELLGAHLITESTPESKPSIPEVLLTGSSSVLGDAAKSEALPEPKPQQPTGQSLVPSKGQSPDKPWDVYRKAFEMKRKPVTEYEWARARRQFLSLDGHNQLAAIRHIYRVCSQREIEFIPKPYNHLIAKDWTATTLPGPSELPVESKVKQAWRLAAERFLRRKRP